MDSQPLPEGMIPGLLAACERIDARRPEVVQTHISHLFLTKDRVYKVRRAVRLSFLSFATRAERNDDCLREVRLNRRLARDVYLGVAPVRVVDGRWEIGPVSENLALDGDGTLPEHCVVMRRLPAGRDGQALVAAGKLGGREIEATARHLAAFHRDSNLGAPAPFPADRWRSLQEQPLLDCLSEVEEHTVELAGKQRVAELGEIARRRLHELRAVFEQRRLAGRAVDGHGDLQLAHLWLADDPDDPRIIDCTEFSEKFRRIDTTCDLAFMSMDLRYRGRADLAERLLSGYAAASDDFSLYHVIDWFEAYRSLVRCKVALLAEADPAIPQEQRRAARVSAAGHLTLAERLLAPSTQGRLFVVCGGVGSGKSTVARHIAQAMGGAVVSSDMARKVLAGLEPTDHTYGGAAPEGAIYDATMTDRVYAGLAERALPILESGRTAVLDATFATAAHRARVRAWAATHGLTPWLVEVRCNEETVRERITRRAATGQDASDAGPELLAWSAARFEAPEEWPDEGLIVSTDAGDWQRALDERLR